MIAVQLLAELTKRDQFVQYVSKNQAPRQVYLQKLKGTKMLTGVENMFKGWMGSFYKLLSKQQRANLLQLYEDLFDKSICVVNKKLVISDRSNNQNKEETDERMDAGNADSY